MQTMFGEYFIFWLFGGFAVIVGIVSYFAGLRQAKRLEELRGLSAAHGFEFFPDGLSEKPKGFFESLMGRPGDPLVGALQAFHPFDFGINKHAYNLLVKTIDDRCVYAMDYVAETVENDGKTARKRKHHFCVVAIKHGFIWPHIRLSPEGFEHRVARMFGMKELTLESEEFNKKYFVVVEDDRTAYDILHPKSIDFLLRVPAREWQMANMHLVVTAQGEMSAQEIRRVIQDMNDFIDHLPDYVRQDRGFQPKWNGALDF
jgi:hypothetical protein